VLGVLAGAFDRDIFRGSIKRRLVGFLLRRLYSIQENRVSRNMGADNPGWNDYSLALWGMTGSELQIEELHQRAASDPHALWLVNVCRNEIPDFDEQLKALETRLGAPIPPMDPVTGVGLRRSI
jgi:hypothetical protein